MNELYIRELARAKREAEAAGRGAQFKKDVAVEAQSSILRPDGIRSSTRDDKKSNQETSTPVRSEEEIEAARLQTLAKFDALRNRLLSDTAFVGILAMCATWAVADVRATISMGLGVAGSLAYVFLLARGVSRISASGDSLAPARLILLGALVVGAARRREVFDVLPVMLGFFSYKVATVLPLLTGEAFDDDYEALDA